MSLKDDLDKIRAHANADERIRLGYEAVVRQLSGAELSKLAERMTETDDAVEAARIRETIVRGFYGTKKSNA